MKKLLLLIGLVACTTTLLQAQCSDLFFSEYVEGSQNNKALEIYNPTDNAIDLADYRIIRWSNGNASPNELYFVELTGTIAPKDVFVIVLDKQDCSLSGQDTCVWEELKNKADLFASPVYDENRTLYHNGNDAISLNKINDQSQFPFGAFVDIFGLIGEDPDDPSTGFVEGWTDTFPYVGEAGGAFWTRDQTLVRKASVTSGITTNPGVPFEGEWNPTAQWDSLPRNTFSRLGCHICDCGTAASTEDCLVSGIEDYTDQLVDAQLDVFPNPTQGIFTVSSDQIIQLVSVYTISGQLVAVTPVLDQTTELRLTNTATGTYLVKVQLQDGQTTFRKIVLQ